MAIMRFDTQQFQESISTNKHMKELIPTLKEINRLGLLTIESQPGKHVNYKHFLTNEDVEYSEKAFIAGFMQEELATKFIQYFNINTDKFAMAITIAGNEVDMSVKLDFPMRIIKNKFQCTTEVHKHMSTSVPIDWFMVKRSHLFISPRENLVYLYCFDNKWNRLGNAEDGLFTDVLNALTFIDNILKKNKNNV
jgi:hypothetical protein